MDFERQVTFELDDGLYRRALNRFWLRAYGIRQIVWAGVVGPALIGLSFTAMRPVALAVCWSLYAVLVVVSLASYFKYVRNAMRAQSKFENHSVTYRFSNRGVSVSSELGSTELKWRAFEKLWKRSDLWFLFLDKNQFLVLPADQLDEDLRAFIERCVRLTGGGRPKCYKCGYDLRGQQALRCPECGTAFEKDLLEIDQ